MSTEANAVILKMGFDTTNLKQGLEQATAAQQNYKAQAVSVQQELTRAKIRYSQEFSAQNRRETEERLAQLRIEAAEVAVRLESGVRPLWREPLDIANYPGEFVTVAEDTHFLIRPLGGSLHVKDPDALGLFVGQIYLVRKFLPPHVGTCWQPADLTLVAENYREFERTHRGEYATCF
ncbi:MAG: hypothetical protein ACYDCD_02605 [Candidatus Acidiferrales bacterium]